MFDSILGWVEISLLVVELIVLFYIIKHILVLENHEKSLEQHEKSLEKKVEELKSHLERKLNQ